MSNFKFLKKGVDTITEVIAVTFCLPLFFWILFVYLLKLTLIYLHISVYICTPIVIVLLLTLCYYAAVYRDILLIRSYEFLFYSLDQVKIMRFWCNMLLVEKFIFSSSTRIVAIGIIFIYNFLVFCNYPLFVNYIGIFDQVIATIIIGFFILWFRFYNIVSVNLGCDLFRDFWSSKERVELNLKSDSLAELALLFKVFEYKKRHTLGILPKNVKSVNNRTIFSLFKTTMESLPSKEAYTKLIDFALHKHPRTMTGVLYLGVGSCIAMGGSMVYKDIRSVHDKERKTEIDYELAIRNQNMSIRDKNIEFCKERLKTCEENRILFKKSGDKEYVKEIDAEISTLKKVVYADMKVTKPIIIQGETQFGSNEIYSVFEPYIFKISCFYFI